MIVPVNSRSERALVANLGNLEVHNNFKIVQGGVGEDTAVVDNMAVSFTSLQLSVYVISSCCEFTGFAQLSLCIIVKKLISGFFAWLATDC